MRIVVIAAVVLAAIIGALSWTVAGSPGTNRSNAATEPDRKTYDTTSGQEMRPRWNTGREKADAEKSN